jgi:chemotaxis protein CheX
MSDYLYHPFMEATRNVFQLMLDLSEVSDHIVDGVNYEEELDISIGVIGDLVGEITYRFPYDTSLGMVNIMSGMEMNSVDEFVTSAISEIANIISGNVLTELAQKDIKCDILPPVVNKPEDGTLYKIRTSAIVSTSVGDMGLDIRLNQS